MFTFALHIDHKLSYFVTKFYKKTLDGITYMYDLFLIFVNLLRKFVALETGGG